MTGKAYRGLIGAMVAAGAAVLIAFFVAYRLRVDDARAPVSPAPHARSDKPLESGPVAPAPDAHAAPASPVSSTAEVASTAGFETISGRVVDSAGAPIAGVSVQPHGKTNLGLVKTDEKGRYETRPLNPGAYVLFAIGQANRDGSWIVARTGSRDADIVFPAPGIIEGRVVDAQTGEAVIGYQVHAERVPGDVFFVEPKLFRSKSPSGEFIMDHVKPGTTGVAVYAGGYADAIAKIPALRAGETRRGVVVRVERGAELEGQVVTSKGLPLKGAKIQVGTDQAEGQHNYRIRTYSDENGAFLLPSLHPGPSQFLIEDNHFAPKVLAINVVPGIVNRSRVVLDEGAIVMGQITYAGKPATRCFLEIASSFGWSRHGGPDVDGSYFIQGVPDGPMTITAYLKEPIELQLSAQIVVAGGEAPETHFDFSPPKGRVEGTLFGAPDAPMRSPVEITAFASEPTTGIRRVQCPSDSDGHYDLPLPPGRAVLRVNVAPGRLRFVAIDVLADGTLRRDIALYGGATLRATVNVPAGPAEASLYVLDGVVNIGNVTPEFMDSIVGKLMGTGRVAASGEGVVGGIEPGPHTVLAILSERDPNSGVDAYRQWDSQVIEVKGDEDVSIAMDLSR